MGRLRQPGRISPGEIDVDLLELPPFGLEGFIDRAVEYPGGNAHGEAAFGDLLPLGDLNKTQVWELSRELGVPQEVVERAPSAGLWPGQTDEGEMGITYRELDRVLEAIEAGDTSGIESETLTKVQQMVGRSTHKRAMPPIFKL